MTTQLQFIIIIIIIIIIIPHVPLWRGQEKIYLFSIHQM